MRARYWSRFDIKIRSFHLPEFMVLYYINHKTLGELQYIPRNMHTVFALLCFVVVIHWLIFPYPSGLLHWHCGNLTIVPVPAKQPWWIWINTSCKFIMNDCITTTKQSTTKPCAYFLGYTVGHQYDTELYPAVIHRALWWIYRRAENLYSLVVALLLWTLPYKWDYWKNIIIDVNSQWN